MSDSEGSHGIIWISTDRGESIDDLPTLDNAKKMSFQHDSCKKELLTTLSSSPVVTHLSTKEAQ